MFVGSLCLIASAKVFPIPVKKVLNSVDIDCEFVVSTPLDTIHEVITTYYPMLAGIL